MLTDRSTDAGRAHHSRLRGDRGSALMLMPAAVLVMLVLGAITVDLAVVRLGQRELIAAATDAANDAATMGLDQAELRAGHGYVLDAAQAEQAVLASLDAKGVLDRLAAPPEVTVTTDGTVEVRLARRVPHVFAKALPGVDGDTLVRATGAAMLRVG